MAEQRQQPSWVFWSTRDTINAEVPSITAIIETFVAVIAYWWIAVRYQTYAPLLVSAAVAPLVLLRSEKSVALAAKCFLAWRAAANEERTDKSTLGRKTTDGLLDDMRSTIEELRTARPMLGISAFCFAALCGALFAYLSFRHLLNDTNMPNVLVALAGCCIALVLLGVYRTILDSIIGHPLSIVLNVGMTVGVMIGATTGAALTLGTLSAVSVPAAVTLLEPVFSVTGLMFGLWVLSLFARIIATMRHLVPGVRALPRNFRRLVFCTSPRQEPELMPGLGEQFGLSAAVRSFHRYRAGNILERVVAFVGVPTVILILLLPGWFYRVTLKSTSWFWWPLAFLGSDLRHAHNPAEFRRRTLSSLWAKATIAATLLTLVGFLITNFLLNAAVFDANPLLTVLGYFLLFDWSSPPWQLLLLATSVLSLSIVFLIDDTGGQYRVGVQTGDIALVARAKRKLGWIERLARLRLVLAVMFWLIVGSHTVLYFNSLKCWSRLPVNVQAWAEWVYGQRMPPTCAMPLP